MARVCVTLGVCLAWGACTSSKPAAEPAAEPKAPVAVPAQPAQPPPPPEPPVDVPPSVHLQWLEAHGARGLAIQNRSDRVQQLSADVRLVTEGATRTLKLADDRACLRLRPGGEWLWPPDWEQTLAPDQGWLTGLEGETHFEVRGCGGGEPVRSSVHSLPAAEP